MTRITVIDDLGWITGMIWIQYFDGQLGLGVDLRYPQHRTHHMLKADNPLNASVKGHHNLSQSNAVLTKGLK